MHVVPKKIEGKLFVLVLVVCLAVSLTAAQLMLISERHALIGETEARLARTANRYALEMSGLFAEKVGKGLAANDSVRSAIDEAWGEVSSAPAEVSTRVPDAESEIALNSESAVSFSGKQGMDPQHAALILGTADAWKFLSPVLQQDFSNFYLLTTEGMMRASPREWAEHLPYDFESLRDVLLDLAGPSRNPDREAVWSPVRYDDTWELWVSSLIVPLYKDDRYIGLTGTDYVLNEAFARVNRISVNEGFGTAFVFDGEGQIVSHPKFMETIRAAESSGLHGLPYRRVADKAVERVIAGYLEDAEENRSGHRVRFTIDGTTHFAVVEPLDILGWNLVVMVDSGLLVSHLAALRWKLVATAIGIGLVLVFILGACVRHLILGRIIQLEKATRSLAANENVEFPDAGSDEIGSLIRTFREMAQSLRSRESELHATNEQLRLEMAFRQREERERVLLAAAIEQAAEVILITSMTGRIQYVNPSFERLTGYTRAEAIGELCETMYGGKSDAAAAKSLKHAQDNGETWKGRILSHRKDGTCFPTHATVSPVRDSTERIINFVWVSKDVSKEADLEAQLVQAQKMEAMGELASGIAHEINTPTQYIGDNIRFFQESFVDIANLLESFGELLTLNKENGSDQDAVRKVEDLIDAIDLEYLTQEVPLAIEQSLEGNRRVAEIVRAMKEFAHPGIEDMTSVDINHAIENTIAVARNEWKYVADVETDLEPDMPLVPCLPGAFNQVVLNIFVNAAHAIGDVVGDGIKRKGTIRVSTRSHDGWAEIRIADTGSGIPEENRTKIFDPFFTTKGVGQGTGQGLALAHKVIVEKHSGTLSFESEIGKGTTFIIRLPLHVDEFEPDGE